MSSNTDWMDDMNCLGVDPELFFPSATGVPGQRQAAAAARICAACPVQIECADHRIATGATAGVWGGTVTRMKNAGPSLGGRKNLGLHGTEAGYRRHLRAGEKACPACLGAHSGHGSPNGRSKTRRWSA